MIEDDRILSCGNVRKHFYKEFDYDNYVPIEFIGVNGSQYIITNYVPNSESCIECEFLINNIYDGVDYNYQPLYGASAIYNNNAFEFWPQAYGFSCYDSNNYKSHTGVLLNKKNHVLQNRNVLTVNDKVNTFTYRSFKCPAKLYIFATNRTQQGVSIFNYQNSTCKLYYLTISEKEKILYKFIPVLKKSTNKAGLYDLINGTFYGNSGTGNFITGSQLVRLLVTEKFDNRPANLDYVSKILKETDQKNVNISSPFVKTKPLSAYAFKKILNKN